MAQLSQRLGLPRIIGMLLAGILIGPYVANLIHPQLLAISGDLRSLALMIILIKAGLSLDVADLKKVGRPALLLSFLPASFEILAYCLLAPLIFNISWPDALVMGTVLGAVSPAVVVPRMVNLIDRGYGQDKAIPQMILAGASCDDVFVIVCFSSSLALAQGQGVNLSSFTSIPIAILTGILIGCLLGLGLARFFNRAYQKGDYIRNSSKLIIILALACLLMGLENLLANYFPMSGLLAVMTMSMAVAAKCPKQVRDRLASKFNKVWLAAEMLLFVLVGAAVDIRYTVLAGGLAILMIALALLIRLVGVYLSLLGTALTKRERLFTILAYLPKATVQAAIGSVPLAQGMASGQLILSVAVLAILVTAPLGAWAIDQTYQTWLLPPLVKK
ncbi:cation:proton antiporter [Aerococcus urinaehominis]|nr:cation:proton antiporter [Aerococcus urinaehominis]